MEKRRLEVNIRRIKEGYEVNVISQSHIGNKFTPYNKNEFKYDDFVLKSLHEPGVVGIEKGFYVRGKNTEQDCKTILIRSSKIGKEFVKKLFVAVAEYNYRYGT